MLFEGEIWHEMDITSMLTVDAAKFSDIRSSPVEASRRPKFISIKSNFSEFGY